MVSAKTILILGGIAVFALAGGIGLSKQAFAQVQTDFSSIKTGVSDRVTNVKQSLNREGVETGLTRNEQQVFQTGTVDHFRLSPEALQAGKDASANQEDRTRVIQGITFPVIGGIVQIPKTGGRFSPAPTQKTQAQKIADLQARGGFGN